MSTDVPAAPTTRKIINLSDFYYCTEYILSPGKFRHEEFLARLNADGMPINTRQIMLIPMIMEMWSFFFL
jgi:hypothetical protein